MNTIIAFRQEMAAMEIGKMRTALDHLADRKLAQDEAQARKIVQALANAEEMLAGIELLISTAREMSG